MSGEKTELPTPRKLVDARRKGQFARSTIANGTAPVLGACVALLCFAPAGWSQACAWTRRLLEDMSAPPAECLYSGLRWMVGATAIPALAALALGVGTSIAQAGVAVHTQAVVPSLDRLDPFTGVRRLMDKKQLFEVGKALVLTASVVALTADWLLEHAATLVSTIRGDGFRSSFEMLGVLCGLFVRMLSLLVLLSVGDYLLASRSHKRSLMMSREELQREHKDAEGAPEQRAHRQALQKQLALGGPARGVGTATALVVNPTHVAVALRYDESECESPYIVAKGREADALALRREALRRRIPIIRDVPLARSLVVYDVGEQIPEELYRAAAAVLRAALDEKHSELQPGPLLRS